ncbi:GNAT family N-acetyltransferase [Hoyosella sp. YIM 151337]|uniref:GNAT family N-acetyltransferase n=1 Tax=Hoyosella sp. YIM 151337 TaxID=2992742 RepID=UPI0022367595|nr:GNAT family N-acetyltransferase [Hoyosella sp. YIM 151337]MCW4353924.1 GNAT family N-acetyltransferase [Hoyosella sp. YIM 151337]
MLKLLGARSLGLRDTPAVLRALDTDPVAACMVVSRVEEFGVDPRFLRGELWSRGKPAESLCFSGVNLIPLRGGDDDLRSFADRACRSPRLCSSLVGRAELVLPLWDLLAADWGPPREVRAEQPMLVLRGPSACKPDPLTRRVRIDEFEMYVDAAVKMFIEEVGVDPCAHDGGRSYRYRVRSLIESGRAWARFEDGKVAFKAEVGSMSSRVGQIHGVWVAPEFRGCGIGAGGTATIAESISRAGRLPSLYVNSYNVAARTMYDKVGFSQVATFATVLVD